MRTIKQNLLKNASTTQNINGITYTVNADGIKTARGKKSKKLYEDWISDKTLDTLWSIKTWQSESEAEKQKKLKNQQRKEKSSDIDVYSSVINDEVDCGVASTFVTANEINELKKEIEQIKEKQQRKLRKIIIKVR